jgi:hypothetical protein
VSLLQSPRRPSSSAFALGSTDVFGAVADPQGVPTSRAFDPSRPFSAAGLEDGPRVGLDRELDLSTERPHTGGKASRGPGLLVAAIVSTSIVLGVVIMFARGDVAPGLATEPAAPPAITDVVSAPAEAAQVEPAPAEVAPRTPTTPTTELATQRVPSPVSTPVKAEPVRAEIVPAAIAPAGTARPTEPSTTEPPVEPAEPASALAPGLQLPPPVFAEPEPTKPEPTPPAAADPGNDASAPLPGIEEPPAEPREEPGATAPEAAQPSHAGAPEPAEREPFDHLPARTDRPAS